MTLILVLSAFAGSQGQSRNTYFLSVGPAVTSNSDWGSGHRVGFSAEAGVTRLLSSNWDLVLVGGVERFDVGRPDYAPWIPEEWARSSGWRWGPVHGGNDYVGSLRGGARYKMSAARGVQPYVGPLLGFSLVHQDKATAQVIDPAALPFDAPRLLQQDNSQLGIGLSAIFGLRIVSGPLNKLFFETGYTFVFTPDDSFDDNPAFFPIRVGLVL